jgi:hypothetical protein
MLSDADMLAVAVLLMLFAAAMLDDGDGGPPPTDTGETPCLTYCSRFNTSRP